MGLITKKSNQIFPGEITGISCFAEVQNIQKVNGLNG